MNNWFIIGNLTRDPELRTTNSGMNVCTFNVAVNNPRDKDNPLYVRVSTFGKNADNCNSYLAKGRKVACCGECKLNEYTTNTGEKRANLELLANTVEFLTPKGENSGNGANFNGNGAKNNASRNASGNNLEGYEEVETDGLPF